MFAAKSRLFIALILNAIVCINVAAQCPRWEKGPLTNIADANPNGQVLAMTMWDPDVAGPVQPLLVVGGTFTSIGGISANRIAVFNGFHWSPLGSGCNGDVRALGVFNSHLIAGGDFTNAGGVAVNHIARWTGSTWNAMGTGTVGGPFSGRVTALTLYNSELIVGGSFTAAGGLAANCIARWNGTTWGGLGSGMTFPLNTPRVECLTVFEGELYAGGLFSTAGGNPANNIARWNGSAWSKLGFAGFTDNGADSVVRCFLIHDFGGTAGEQLVVGGSFTNVSTGLVTLASPAVARWSGSNWFATGTGLPGATVGGLASGSAGVIAGGFFPGAFGSIALYRLSTGQWEAGVGAIESGSIQCMLNINQPYSSGFEIIAGGVFTAVGGLGISNLSKVDSLDLELYPWDLGFTPFAFATVGSRLIAAGYGSQSTQSGFSDNIMSWDGVQLRSLGNGLQGYATALETRAQSPTTTNLFIGGWFSIAGNVAASNVAMWTYNSETQAETWSPMGNGFNNQVMTIERVAANSIFNESIYAGGFFTASGNGATTFNRVAVWDVPSSTWFALGTGFNGAVNALKGFNTSSFGRDVIAGGHFTTASGVSANHIALWRAPNQSGWVPMGSGFNSSVDAIERHNGSIYAGGGFTMSGGNGGTPLTRIARWTGTTWEQVGGGLPTAVRALLSKDGFLYALCSGSQSAVLMKWDGTTWTELQGGPESVDGFSNLFAIGAYQDELHVGGFFDSVNNGIASPDWARFLETGAPWIVNQPIEQLKPCGGFAHFSVQPATGYSNVTYAWRRDGVPLSNGASGHGSTINGADSSVLSIFNLKNEDFGEYDCVVSNECGGETSAAAWLNVFPFCCPGDFNADQMVGVPDLLVVINFWGPCPGGCDADIAPPGGDGAVGVPDLLYIINNWGTCP